MFHDSTPTPAAKVRRHQKQRPAVRSHYKLDEVAEFILAGNSAPPAESVPFKRVALQFPDELLEDAIAVMEKLKGLLAEKLGCAEVAEVSTQAVNEDRVKAEAVAVNDKKIRLFVLADNTFGSCCPDEITAQHYGGECIIHFGDACMSRSTRIPVFYVQDNFRFTALATYPQAEARAISVRILLCAVRILQRRLKGLCDVLEEKGISAGVSLVVVGNHRSRGLVDAAARHWLSEPQTATSTDCNVLVEWGNFDSVDVTTHTPDAFMPSSFERPSWIINGVRFSRADPSVLQHFLFVGTSSALFPLHLLNVHQYNLFHHPEELREVAFESENAPALTILDENFGCGGEAGLADDAVGGDVDDGMRKMEAAVEAHFDSNNSKLAPIQATLSKRMRQRAFNMELIRCSSAVGIVVASLAIEGYYETTMLLYRFLRAHGKRAYIIYVGHLNKYKIANFVDTVDCFVLIACPNSRESHFPTKEDDFSKPIVSPIEVILALRMEDCDSPLFGHPAVYSTTFDSVLPLLREAMQAVENARAAGDTSTVAVPMEDGCGAALIRASAGVVATQGANGALARLHERTFVGLDPKNGQTPVQDEILEGRHGIARGYTTERKQQDGEW
ncbi:putative diphthamide synthesis protein [Trypanosoma rangeli]|uniref:Putative diphthamide synthesis protein n=1 Tax=Trypanosoma rangeli TaxID=5698 RepID=A0A3S5ISG6_TRYRA|nr:putative diphthamide synthesis protein [Trypanosoma rangeli]RNF11114.1 putative diphthamide synthesis protein [Trypanosoma rangeli]|eukprot:RNF11114.1 putative diphthamide synthesis protein [Trypanosoma rangeli]